MRKLGIFLILLCFLTPCRAQTALGKSPYDRILINLFDPTANNFGKTNIDTIADALARFSGYPGGITNVIGTNVNVGFLIVGRTMFLYTNSASINPNSLTNNETRPTTFRTNVTILNYLVVTNELLPGRFLKIYAAVADNGFGAGPTTNWYVADSHFNFINFGDDGSMRMEAAGSIAQLSFDPSGEVILNSGNDKHVVLAGGVTIPESPSDGYFFTSDANGNGSWQPLPGNLNLWSAIAPSDLTVPIANVTGKGALATLNTVNSNLLSGQWNYSQIFGVPAFLTSISSNNISGQINAGQLFGLGTLATLNTVNSNLLSGQWNYGQIFGVPAFLTSVTSNNFSGALNVGQLFGVIPIIQLPSNNITTNNASTLSSGTLPLARLSNVTSNQVLSSVVAINSAASGQATNDSAGNNIATLLNQKPNSADLGPAAYLASTDWSSSHVTWVDNSGGNNTIHDPANPFDTVEQAVAASPAGDLIQANAGTFFPHVVSNSCSFYFAPGTILIMDQVQNGDASAYLPMFTDWNSLTIDPDTEEQTWNGFLALPFDNAGGVTNIISGQAVILADNGDPTGNSIYNPPLFWLVKSQSVFSIELDSIYKYEGDPMLGILIDGPKQTDLKLKRIHWKVSSPDNGARAPILWEDGDANISIGTIEAEGDADCFDITDLEDSLGINVFGSDAKLVMNSSFLDARLSTGNCIWWYGSPNNRQRHIFNVPLLMSGSGSVYDNVGGNGKHYLSGGGAGIIDNGSSTKAMFTIEGDNNHSLNVTNQLWVGGYAKAQDTGGGGFYDYNGSSIAQGNMEFNVDEWTEKSTSYVTGFKIRWGSHTFTGNKGISIPNGRALWISNAVVTVNGLTINTSAASGTTNDCIFIAGSSANNVVTLNDCTLIAAAGVNALNASNAQTVVLNNCRIIGGINTNITVSTTGTNYFGNIVTTSLTVKSNFNIPPSLLPVPLLFSTNISAAWNATTNVNLVVAHTGAGTFKINFTNSGAFSEGTYWIIKNRSTNNLTLECVTTNSFEEAPTIRSTNYTVGSGASTFLILNKTNFLIN